MVLNRKPPKNLPSTMYKFSIRQKTKRFWIVVSILIVGIIGVFSSTALATIQPGTDMNSITGKDIPGSSLPLIINNTATSAQNTWGRIIRITGSNTVNVPPHNGNSFFDLGIDDQGNFFINTPNDTKTAHSFMISPTGVVTINKR
jgi:hypothetical protein